MSILKVSKLTFFLTAADCGLDGTNYLLERTFDKFVAMPFGHVESEIYSTLKQNNGVLEHCKITNSSGQLKEGSSMASIRESLNPFDAERIDKALLELKTLNSKLIIQKPFDLVELSHNWYSWKKNYNEALYFGKNSQSIPATDIIEEEKNYFL